MAKRLRSSPRAVGQALKANPFAPRVPCHRVVAANGLGGYGGRWNSTRKRRLLAREGVVAPRS
jgi:methylated-DNA-[protein]-cysteine S-methyltransferase